VAEDIDLRCLTPLDSATFGASVQKTGRMVVSDTGHGPYGVCAEAIVCLPEAAFLSLKAAAEAIGCADRLPLKPPSVPQWRDVPDPSLTGPYDG
jgi:pyruvate/2-oxoglutarate/acetoin dehydrogenase E1 component